MEALAIAVAPVEVAANDESACVVGKRLLTHLYIHKNYVHRLPDELKVLVAQALRVAGEFDFDLVKVAHDGSHVCLLRYPNFDTDPHPSLMYSIKVQLSNGQFCLTDYSRNVNPPILHRKELFVGSDYRLYSKFLALTLAEEKLGLLCRPNIGNKKQWKALLATKKVTLRGHKLVEAQ